MKAYVIRSFGGPEVLKIEEVEEPKPGKGEVAVRVASTSVNRSDMLVRSGHPDYRVKTPWIPGTDVFGYVEAVGEGVEGFEEGEPVISNFIYGCGRCRYCSMGQENLCRNKQIINQTRWGAYAERIVVPARALIKVHGFPNKEELGALPVVLGTAWRSLVNLLRVRAGQKVFIWGASGGLGSHAVQLAKLLGATVIAAVGSGEKGRMVSSIGADQTVNYREENVLSRVMELTGDEGVDAVLNSVGGDTVQLSIDMLRPGGTLAIIGVIGGSEAKIALRRAYLRGITITGTAGGNRWELMEALETVRTGQIRPVIGKKYTFEELPEAHRDVEAGRIFGKALILLQKT